MASSQQPPGQQPAGFLFAPELFLPPPSSNVPDQVVVPDFQPYWSSGEGFEAPFDAAFSRSGSFLPQTVYREPNNMAGATDTIGAPYSGMYPPFWYEELEAESGGHTEQEEPPHRPRPSKVRKISHPTAVKTPGDVQSTTFKWINMAMDRAFDESNPIQATETAPAVISPVARNEGRASVLKKRKRGDDTKKADDEYETYAELPSYPPSSLPLPKNMSMQTICRERPNHLIGKHLDAFIQRMFTGLDIYNLLPDDAIKEFTEMGVMSSQHKNRANFLTKRLNKRMNSFTPETMKALIESPQLRPCNDDGSYKMGASKLQGKYTNKQAQPVRSMPRRKYNGLSAEKKKIMKERDAAAEKKSASKETGATTAEEQSDIDQEINDNVQFDITPSAAPLASNPPSPTLRTPVEAEAPVPQLDRTDYYKSAEFNRFSAGMGDRWNHQKLLGETVLALDLDFCNPLSPGRAEMLVQMGLWIVNAETLTLVNYHDAEECPAWAGLLHTLFETALSNRLPTKGSVDETQLALLREQTTIQLLGASSSQSKVLEKLVERAKAEFMVPTKDFASQALYGDQTDVITTGTTDDIDNDIVLDPALLQFDTLQAQAPENEYPTPVLSDHHFEYSCSGLDESPNGYFNLGQYDTQHAYINSGLYEPQSAYPTSGQYEPQSVYPNSGQQYPQSAYPGLGMQESQCQYPSHEANPFPYVYHSSEDHFQVLPESPCKGKKRARDDDEVADAPRKRTRGF